MLLRRLDTLTTITLPDGLYWSDEFDDVPYAEREERANSGVLLVFRQVKTGGQNMTLSASDDKNWVSAEVVKRLYSWARIPELEMSLHYPDLGTVREFKVSFRLANGKPLQARPVLDAKILSAESYYHLSLNFRLHSELT